jgi:hypothetical protein
MADTSVCGPMDESFPAGGLGRDIRAPDLFLQDEVRSPTPHTPGLLAPLNYAHGEQEWYTKEKLGFGGGEALVESRSQSIEEPAEIAVLVSDLSLTYNLDTAALYSLDTEALAGAEGRGDEGAVVPGSEGGVVKDKVDGEEPPLRTAEESFSSSPSDEQYHDPRQQQQEQQQQQQDSIPSESASPDAEAPDTHPLPQRPANRGPPLSGPTLFVGPLPTIEASENLPFFEVSFALEGIPPPPKRNMSNTVLFACPNPVEPSPGLLT